MLNLQTNHSHLTISSSFPRSPTFTSHDLHLDEREQINSRLPESTQSRAAGCLTLWLCGMAWANMERVSSSHSPRATTRSKTVPFWGLTAAVSLLQSRVPTPAPVPASAGAVLHPLLTQGQQAPTHTSWPSAFITQPHTISIHCHLECLQPPVSCIAWRHRNTNRASVRRNLAPANLQVATSMAHST